MHEIIAIGLADKKLLMELLESDEKNKYEVVEIV